MSKERELLKECRLMLDNTFNGSAGLGLRDRITELLDQPEQEPTIGMYPGIFDNYKYILEAFENGGVAKDYNEAIQQAYSDIRKMGNWLYPLPNHIIEDTITKECLYRGTFDFRVFARELEKQHGIGYTE